MCIKSVLFKFWSSLQNGLYHHRLVQHGSNKELSAHYESRSREQNCCCLGTWYSINSKPLNKTVALSSSM